MAPTQNPYAPPKSFDSNAPASETKKGIWRDDKDLIIVHDVPLPSRCVKCNAPATPCTKPMKLWWHPRGYYLLIVLSPLIYIIAALIARKSAKVSPALCDGHKKRRSNAILIGWSGAIPCFALWIAGSMVNQPLLSVLGFLGLLACIIFGVIRARIVYARRIDDINVRMRGCGEAFLDSLPRSPG